VFRRRLVPILLFAVFAALVLFPAFSTLVTDWWWFREIGYEIVFTRELTTRVLLFLTVGGLTAGVLYLNLAAAQWGLVPDRVVLRFGPAAPPLDISAALRRLTLPVSLVLGPASLPPRPGIWCSGCSTRRRSGLQTRSSRATSDSTSSPCPVSRPRSGG
jgi:hypothetical protein